MRTLIWEASRARRGNMTAAAKTPSGARPDSFLPAIGDAGLATALKGSFWRSIRNNQTRTFVSYHLLVL